MGPRSICLCPGGRPVQPVRSSMGEARLRPHARVTRCRLEGASPKLTVVKTGSDGFGSYRRLCSGGLRRPVTSQRVATQPALLSPSVPRSSIHAGLDRLTLGQIPNALVSRPLAGDRVSPRALNAPGRGRLQPMPRRRLDTRCTRAARGGEPSAC